MEVTLYNPEKNITQMILINEITDLICFGEIYFGIENEKQQFLYNNKEINLNGSLETYDISQDSLIIIKENIENNIYEKNLEDLKNQALISYTLLHLEGQYNEFSFKLMLDSGAQVSIISTFMANLLGLTENIDRTMRGVAQGVGSETKILGCCYGVNIKINNNIFPINFKILDNELDKYLVILGLDFLNSNKCKIDFEGRTITINKEINKLLNEQEIDDLKIPINVIKKN